MTGISHAVDGEPFLITHFAINGISGAQASFGDPTAGVLLGTALYRVVDGHAVVDGITVEEPYRHRGVAFALLSSIEQAAGLPVKIGPGRNTAAGKSLFAAYAARRAT